GQARRQQLLTEMLQVLQGKPVRTKTLLEGLLRIVQGVRAIHQPDEEVLLFLEAIIAQADRVLDHIVGAPLILLRRDVQIAPDAQSYLFAALQIAGRNFRMHGSISKSEIRNSKSETNPKSESSNVQNRVFIRFLFSSLVLELVSDFEFRISDFSCFTASWAGPPQSPSDQSSGDIWECRPHFASSGYPDER